MTLDPEGPLDARAVEEICTLQDDRYRNQWITYAYHRLSCRLAEITGNNANWFTFGRWSSFTVGENLRTDQPGLAFATMVRDKVVLRPFAGPLVRLQRELHVMNDAAMPRALALGNQWVFHEIGHAMACFLTWYDENPDASEEDFGAWLATIEPDPPTALFPSGDPQWWREGLTCYFRATRAASGSKRQAELVLRANLRLAEYEQWRLHPIIAIALDPVARRIVEFDNARPHTPGEPVARLRNGGTPWELSHRNPVERGFVKRYETFMTSHVFAWEGPIRGPLAPLYLGAGLPETPAGMPLYPPPLETIDDPETRALIDRFDQSNGTRDGRRARNWVDFEERMNFVVQLFRAEQRDRGLYADVSERERRVLDLRLSDEVLDDVRRQGDDEADGIVAEYCRTHEGDARTLVHGMVLNGFDTYKALRPDIALPPWASQQLLRRGRDFLAEHGLEIAAALFCGSLPYSYTASQGASVLVRTAEMLHGHTTRRLAETGRMLLDLMEDGDPPLAPGSDASNAVLGVRLFHAAVRHMVREHDADPWDENERGTPINQEDLLGTLVVFTVVVLEALDTLGILADGEDDDADRAAYVHYWLVVGHLLGIDYSRFRGTYLNPSDQPFTLDELRLIGESISRRHAMPSDDGRQLMADLLEVMRTQMPHPILKDVPAALTRVFVGDRHADMLAVPRVGRTVFALNTLRALRPIARAVSPRARMPWARKLARTTTIDVYTQWINDKHGSRPPWRVGPRARALGIPAPDARPAARSVVELAEEEPGAARGGGGADVGEEPGCPNGIAPDSA